MTVATLTNLAVAGVAFIVWLVLLSYASLTGLSLTRRMRFFAYSQLVWLAPLPLAATVWIVSYGAFALFAVLPVLGLWFGVSIVFLEVQFRSYRAWRKRLEWLWLEYPNMRGLLRWSWELYGMDLPGHDRDARRARASMPVFGVVYRALDVLLRAW